MAAPVTARDQRRGLRHASASSGPALASAAHHSEAWLSQFKRLSRRWRSGWSVTAVPRQVGRGGAPAPRLPSKRAARSVEAREPPPLDVLLAPIPSKAMSYDRMQEAERRLEGEIAALLRQADETDETEDACLGAEVRGDELPAELRRREERLAAIRAAKARLEAAARAADDARGRQPGQDRNPKGGRPYKRAYGEPDEKAQSNFTDPESSIMKTSNEGFQQCYNAQVAVDGEHQLVVATGLTANASDQGELLNRTLALSTASTGRCPLRTEGARTGSARCSTMLVSDYRTPDTGLTERLHPGIQDEGAEPLASSLVSDKSHQISGERARFSSAAGFL